jgi:hypothetical protein
MWPRVAHRQSDVVIGPPRDCTVGTTIESSPVEVDYILRSAIYAMLNRQQTLAFTGKQSDREWNDLAPLAFTRKRFDRKRRGLADFSGTDRMAFKRVAPLPYLLIWTIILRIPIVCYPLAIRNLRAHDPAFTGSYLPAVLNITESRTVYLYPHRCKGCWVIVAFGGQERSWGMSRYHKRLCPLNSIH